RRGERIMVAKKTRKTDGSRTAKKSTKKTAAVAAAANLFLINMVPKALSSETNQDSEPHLTVNSNNPKQIVGTAFTPDPALGANAPIYVSVDAGNTWVLNSIVPSAAGSGLGTGDITTSFNLNASRLYGGILRAVTSAMEFLRTTSFSSAVPMAVLKSRAN